jgi:hypothetical protein
MIVSAHRLDEYLQATRLLLAPDHVQLKIDLTPGVDVAPMIFAQINTNRDGVISDAEGEAYARLFLEDVAFEADGKPYHLDVVSSDFPSFAEMREGVGTIRIEARATWQATSGRHSLLFRNSHKPEIGAYLVNALVPASRDIKITGQQRDALQREMRLDVSVESPPADTMRRSSPIFVAFAVGLSALVGLVCLRWL